MAATLGERLACGFVREKWKCEARERKREREREREKTLKEVSARDKREWGANLLGWFYCDLLLIFNYG